MQIYTGSPGGSEAKMERMRELGLGIMLSSEVNKKYAEFPCALDNGAFEAWRRGYPWSEKRFLDMIERAWASGIELDFIVAPDIVMGGRKSLDRSISWIDRLRPARLALAVQDGIQPPDIDVSIHREFAYIFVGGSLAYKWATSKKWVEFAHAHNLKCHIGRCGTLDKMQYAFEIGADSIDSTSIVRNESWHIVEQLQSPIQTNAFAAQKKEESTAHQPTNKGTKCPQLAMVEEY